MAASIYDLVIEQGATFSLTIMLKKPDKQPFPLVGYTGRSQIRKNYAAPDIMAEFSVSIASPQKEGKVIMSLTDEQTAALAAVSGVYDLELESPTGEVTRIIQGKVTISPEVTRPAG